MKYNLTIEQIKQIKELSPYKTDGEVADILGVPKSVVARYRKRLGIEKGKAREKQTFTYVSEAKQKKDFYKNFQNSQQFRILEQLYDDDELKFYFEEYWVHVKELHKAGEELTAAEKRALDNLIQTKIRLNRYLNNERILMDELIKATDAEEKKEIQAKLDRTAKSIKDMQDLYISIQKTLELTKQARTKKRQSTKINILSLLEEMKEDKLKLGIGYWMDLSEKALMTIFEDWREEGVIEATT